MSNNVTNIIIKREREKERYLQAVDTKNTSQDNGNDVLNHSSRVHDTHGGNTNTRLGGTIGSTDVAQAQCSCNTSEAEEGCAGGAGLV